MKVDFIADTNFLIYVHEGSPEIAPFLEYNFSISFISEIELLGYVGLTAYEIKKLEDLVSDCQCFGWDSSIKYHTI